MAKEETVVLIAGGSGFLGKEVARELSRMAEVRILTRNKNSTQKGFFYWEPEKGEIDPKALEGVTHLINLCGESIADKRWTPARKKKLYDSRIKPARFLYSLRAQMPTLQQYISASGINCYDYSQHDKIYTEEDPIARDYVSQLVAAWEEEADSFQDLCKVVKLRISFVLSFEGGGLSKLEKPVKMGFASVLGSGKQWMPWIQVEDLARMFAFSIEKQLDGIYNACAGTTTNSEITSLLAQRYGKKMWLPSVPAFVLKIMLGELAVLVLEGVNVSSAKIEAEGFRFNHSDLAEWVLAKK